MIDEVDLYLMDLESKFKKIDFSKYYLSYSGGRDSHFLCWFIKNILKDNKIKITSVNTRFEHPQISTRMYNNADKVLIPKYTFKQIKELVGIPCFTKQQDDFISRYQRGSRADGGEAEDQPGGIDEQFPWRRAARARSAEGRDG